MFALAMLGIASAQKYCVIDSEKVFKSLEEYNKALTTLDELGKHTKPRWIPNTRA